MNKENHEKLLELVGISKLVGYNLVLANKAELISIEKGKEVSIVSYDYGSSCIGQIEKHLRQKAKIMRADCGEQLLTFAPLAFQINHRINLGDYYAEVIAFANLDGELILDPKDPTLDDADQFNVAIVAKCPFTVEGVHQMSDYFANFMYDVKSAQSKEKSEPVKAETDEEKIKRLLEDLSDINVLDALLRKWHSYTEAEKEAFAQQHAHGISMYVIKGALEMAARDKNLPT